MSVPQRRYLVNKKGKKKAVVLPIKRYGRLMEDLHDLAIVAERREEETVDGWKRGEVVTSGWPSDEVFP